MIGATGVHIPHNTIHTVLKSEGLANTESKKGGKSKWVRYERTYSNSLWHTDYKQLSTAGGSCVVKTMLRAL